MPEIKKKRAPSVDSDQRAWTQVYDDMNDVINSVNQKSAVESRNGASGLDGDIRLFKDVDKTKYFIEGKFADGWAKRELLFSDSSNETQDESINFSATESYVKPDGTVPFTAKQSGIAPTNAAHLSTKGYTDVGRLVSVTKSGNNLIFGMTDATTNLTFSGFGSNAYNSTTIPTTFVSSLTNEDASGQTLIADSTGSLYRLGGGENITITTDDPGGGQTWVQIDCDINTSTFVTTSARRFGEIRTADHDDAWDEVYPGDRLSSATMDSIIINKDESTVLVEQTSVRVPESGTNYDAIKLNVDLASLPDMTQAWANNTDQFIVLDAGVSKRKQSSEIFGSNAFNSTAFLTAITNSQNSTGVTLISASTGELYRLGGGENITISNEAPPGYGAENWVQIDCDIDTSTFLTTSSARLTQIRTGDHNDAWVDTYTGATISGVAGKAIVYDNDGSNVVLTETSITIPESGTSYPAIRLNASGFLASNHAASGVTTTKITNWDNAYGWGNHATENYLKKLEDTAATSGSLPSDHVALIEDYGVSADTAKIYNVASANSNLTIEDAEDGSGNGYIKFTVADQVTSIDRIDQVYAEDEGDTTVTSQAAASGDDILTFKDTDDTTWTISGPTNNRIYASVDIDHPADTNTTYSVSIPTSTTKLRLTAGGSGSGTDDIEFVGSGATTVTRTNADKFTISSTDTNTTTVTSTLATNESSTPHVYSLMDTADQIFALEEGSGINIEESATGGGDTIKISSTVDTSGLLTNGLYLVEAYKDDAVTTTATASGADKLRFIETDDIEWVISGPTLDVITITPTINFPADTHRAIHDTPVNGATTTSISSNWAFDNVKTAVPSGAAFTDWTTDQGSTNIHSGNYTDTNTTDIDSTSATTGSYYSLVEDSDTVRALEAGTGITLSEEGTGGGDVIKITNSVSAGLSDGIGRVEVWVDDAVDEYANASGEDTIRLVQTDDVEWAVAGPTSDIITITPTINFPSDNNTVTSVREDSGTYRTGNITLQSGTNVTITEPSTGVFDIASADQYTGTVTGTGSANKYARWTGGSTLETRSYAEVRSDLGIADNEIIDWTTDQGSTNIHSGNYTNTVYPGISESVATGGSVVSMIDDDTTVLSLEAGTGITIEDSSTGSGDTVKISSSVSGGLSNGLVRVESFDDTDAISSNVNASGGDTLRLVDAGIVTWAVTGSGDIISVTPTFDLSGYATSSHNHSASTITSGTLADARLPSDCGANTSYAASSHDHDSRYYTESEIDTSLALKANLSHADFSSISLNSHSFPASTGTSSNSWPGLIVGGTTRLVASGADLQVKSFIRICQHLIMHEDDSTNVLNQVGLTYANDNLTVWQASGSGQDNFHVPGDVIAYKSSDPRLKTNKEELENPLYKLSKIKGYRFDWLPEAKKYNSYNEGTDIGVMSNEVEQMYPELVQTRSSGYKAVDYEKLTAVLIAAVNDLTSKLIEKGVLDEELQSSKSCC